MEECDQQDRSVSDKFGIISPCSATYFMKVGASVSLKPATKTSFGGKKILKIYIFRVLFQSKNGDVRPKKLSLSDKFGMLISRLDTYFVDKSAHALLKVATKGSFRGKRYRKFSIFRLFFWNKNGWVQPKRLKYLPWIWHHYTLFSYIFSGNRCTLFMESSHQSFF